MSKSGGAANLTQVAAETLSKTTAVVAESVPCADETEVPCASTRQAPRADGLSCTRLHREEHAKSDAQSVASAGLYTRGLAEPATEQTTRDALHLADTTSCNIPPNETAPERLARPDMPAQKTPAALNTTIAKAGEVGEQWPGDHMSCTRAAGFDPASGMTESPRLRPGQCAGQVAQALTGAQGHTKPNGRPGNSSTPNPQQLHRAQSSSAIASDQIGKLLSVAPAVQESVPMTRTLSESRVQRGRVDLLSPKSEVPMRLRAHMSNQDLSSLNVANSVVGTAEPLSSPPVHETRGQTAHNKDASRAEAGDVGDIARAGGTVPENGNASAVGRAPEDGSEGMLSHNEVREKDAQKRSSRARISAGSPAREMVCSPRSDEGKNEEVRVRLGAVPDAVSLNVANSVLGTAEPGVTSPEMQDALGEDQPIGCSQVLVQPRAQAESGRARMSISRASEPKPAEAFAPDPSTVGVALGSGTPGGMVLRVPSESDYNSATACDTIHQMQMGVPGAERHSRGEGEASMPVGDSSGQLASSQQHGRARVADQRPPIPPNGSAGGVRQSVVCTTQARSGQGVAVQSPGFSVDSSMPSVQPEPTDVRGEQACRRITRSMGRQGENQESNASKGSRNKKRGAENNDNSGTRHKRSRD